MIEKPVTFVEVADVKDTTISNDKPLNDEAANFPWLERNEEEPEIKSAKTLNRFPVLGALGLGGSALTVVFSFLVLHFFDGTEVITTKHHHLFPKPAAWLSFILSLNTALVYLAVSRGIAYTWWVRAKKPSTTVTDPYNIWLPGTSIIKAAIEWRAFKYIALATITVATLPANGVLLQNAITTIQNSRSNNDTTTLFNVAAGLPSGFSAELNNDGTISTLHPAWQVAMPFLIGNQNGYYETYENSTNCSGRCLANISAIGFNAICKDTSDFYTIPLDSQQSNGTVDHLIFETSIDWNPSKPYSMKLYATWKNDSACEGFREVRHCNLTFGTVTHQADVFHKEDKDFGRSSYQWSLHDGPVPHDSVGYVESSSLSFKPYDDSALEKERNQNKTTFGGIVQAFATYYNSSIIVKSTPNDTLLLTEGIYARQAQQHKGKDVCETAFNTFQLGNYLYNSPVDYILYEMRTALFYISVWAGEWDGHNGNFDSIWGQDVPPSPYPQIVPHSSEEIIRDEYNVTWFWWGAHVFITQLIVLFILPMIYRF